MKYENNNNYYILLFYIIIVVITVASRAVQNICSHSQCASSIISFRSLFSLISNFLCRIHLISLHWTSPHSKKCQHVTHWITGSDQTQDYQGHSSTLAGVGLRSFIPFHCQVRGQKEAGNTGLILRPINEKWRLSWESGKAWKAHPQTMSCSWRWADIPELVLGVILQPILWFLFIYLFIYIEV